MTTSSDGRAPATGNARLLLVDDDPDILELTLVVLRTNGFIVKACPDPRSTVLVAQSFRPHLILLDAMMPVMDGAAVLREIRTNPATAATPVVFLTARSDAESIRHFLLMGAQDVIAKPFDPLTICSRLAGMLTWGGEAPASTARTT